MNLRALLPFFTLLAACSSEEAAATPTPCNKDPWQCATGQTCWPKDTAGTFACLNSATGAKKGDVCTNTIGAPTCGDGLACFQAVGAATGSCMTYCDPAKAGRGCAAGEQCSVVQLSVSGATFMICVAPQTTTDAGTDTATTDTGRVSDTGSVGDTGSVSDAGATDGGSD